MSKYTKKNQQTGHPAKKDPVIARLSKLQTEVVLLTAQLDGRLTEEQYWHFKAAAFALMDTYAILTGMPRPDTQTTMNFDEFMEEKESARNEAKKKRPGAEIDLLIVDEINPETPIEDLIRPCERCNHMVFNHVTSGGLYYNCSFTNCVCNKFV